MLSLCLSRACLGKMIVFKYKWLNKKAVFCRRDGDRHSGRLQGRRARCGWGLRWRYVSHGCFRAVEPKQRCVPTPYQICVKTAETSAIEGQLENRENGFETRRHSNSGRFRSNPAVFIPQRRENLGDQSRFKSLGLYTNVERSR